MRTISSIPDIRCEARAPRPGGPNMTQWCCLVPSRKQLRKVKSEDAEVKAEYKRRYWDGWWRWRRWWRGGGGGVCMWGGLDRRKARLDSIALHR
jgi:hypothetical protein